MTNPMENLLDILDACIKDAEENADNHNEMRAESFACGHAYGFLRGLERAREIIRETDNG